MLQMRHGEAHRRHTEGTTTRMAQGRVCTLLVQSISPRNWKVRIRLRDQVSPNPLAPPPHLPESHLLMQHITGVFSKGFSWGRGGGFKTLVHSCALTHHVCTACTCWGDRLRRGALLPPLRVERPQEAGTHTPHAFPDRLVALLAHCAERPALLVLDVLELEHPKQLTPRSHTHLEVVMRWKGFSVQQWFSALQEPDPQQLHPPTTPYQRGLHLLEKPVCVAGTGVMNYVHTVRDLSRPAMPSKLLNKGPVEAGGAKPGRLHVPLLVRFLR
jgi:hypothetical protein